MSIKIRPIQLSEADTLATLGRFTFYEAFWKKNNPDDLEMYLDSAFAKAQLEKELSNPDCHFFFVTVASQIIGYLKFNTANAQNELRDEKGIELERIYIIAPHQGKGLGKQLLDFAENFAKEKDKEYLWLGVWEHNPDAIRLYEKEGYVTFDTHIYTIGNDPQTDHLMRKNFTDERTD